MGGIAGGNSPVDYLLELALERPEVGIAKGFGSDVAVQEWVGKAVTATMGMEMGVPASLPAR